MFVEKERPRPPRLPVPIRRDDTRGRRGASLFGDHVPVSAVDTGVDTASGRWTWRNTLYKRGGVGAVLRICDSASNPDSFRQTPSARYLVHPVELVACWECTPLAAWLAE